jgi:hypothetical protein
MTDDFIFSTARDNRLAAVCLIHYLSSQILTPFLIDPPYTYARKVAGPNRRYKRYVLLVFLRSTTLRAEF